MALATSDCIWHMDGVHSQALCCPGDTPLDNDMDLLFIE
mgnify:CR=1 FL=1